MALISNVDLDYEERKKVKIKSFHENPDKYGIRSITELYKESREWVKSNPNITIIGTALSSWEDTSEKYKNTEEYRRTINISYIENSDMKK